MMWAGQVVADLEIDHSGGHQHSRALQQVPDHVNKSCPHTGVAVVTEESVGVAMHYWVILHIFG
ncbi:hypothetical protein JZ751_002582 [Albula glossodonta]|uniref:Uncharacterized protein n=1 Tax=Albula glossodonta TaxID=121402 RepID=A0A8T2N797_9TELE|nr:hypothetical protein JZ751_002582 [Albula glossodonta]